MNQVARLPLFLIQCFSFLVRCCASSNPRALVFSLRFPCAILSFDLLAQGRIWIVLLRLCWHHAARSEEKESLFGEAVETLSPVSAGSPSLQRVACAPVQQVLQLASDLKYDENFFIIKLPVLYSTQGEGTLQ